MNSLRILTIIVTHNRCELLKRCLDNLREQSKKPTDILVINNGSTDDTSQMLRREGIKSIEQENLGAAAGWNKGIKYAIDNNYDYIWTMDDDGYPDKDAFKKLTANIDQSVSCYASILIREDNHSLFVFPYPKLHLNSFIRLFTPKRSFSGPADLSKFAKNGLFPYVHFFNACLISVNYIKKIGYVNEKLFIYGDEMDYHLRLKKISKFYTVTSAYHFHPSANKRAFDNKKIYFFIRNSLYLNNEHYKLSLFRNVFTILIITFRIAQRNGTRFIFSLIIGSKNYLFYKAIYRGLKCDLDKMKNDLI